MIGVPIESRHVHSSLFLASRVLLLCAFVPAWQFLRTVVVSILSFCALHQIALYASRSRKIDERKVMHRPSIHRIHNSTGPVGKLLAAVDVYFWEWSTHRHPVNLLHWTEEALRAIILVEYSKTRWASRANLLFEWHSGRMILYVMPIQRDESSRSANARRSVFVWASTFFQRILRVKAVDCSRLIALPQAPSFVIFFLWVGFGRRSLRLLQSDPRGRAYHMNSFYTKQARLHGIATKCSVRPEAFGVDMSPYFSLGLSYKMRVEDFEDSQYVKRLRTELAKDEPNLADDAAVCGEPVNYESVYCISYRHLEDKNSEGVHLFIALWVAAQCAEARGYSYFRVWMDKILRQRPGRDSGRWAFHGLLPYAYFPVIAIRNMTEDERERMWLLAEERLAYGNMGLLTIDARSDPLSFRFEQSLKLGPEHSMLIYLRYLCTEESSSEKTFHLEDMQRFKALADRHGTTDDEQDIYDGLFLDEKPEATAPTAQDLPVWFPSILDVESYSALRRREVTIDRIEFQKVENVEFDGYREWFMWKDERMKSPNKVNHALTETSLMEQANLMTVYECGTSLHSVIVIIYRGHTGSLSDKAACICLNYEKQDEDFRILECYRIRLRYERSPRDDAYVDVVKRLLQSNENETVSVVEIDPNELSFLR